MRVLFSWVAWPLAFGMLNEYIEENFDGQPLIPLWVIKIKNICYDSKHIIPLYHLPTYENLTPTSLLFYFPKLKK